MTSRTTRGLKQALFDAYGGFADKRIKNIDKGNLFIIDDRTETDEDARGDLFLWFCQILAEVVDQDTIKITMSGGVPVGPLVTTWFAAHGADASDRGRQFVIRGGEESGLTELASAFLSIVRPRARYPVKAYKYVCPRVAAALVRAQRIMHQAWQT